ncbi:MAG: M14 family metallopeptidase [Alphaproteobacteria bacterium]
MHPEVHFAASYADARAKFLAAALDAGAAVRRLIHPERGPAGETLAIDVARLGPATARRVLVVVSATHGAEGFCGSGFQTGLLAERDAPRPPAADTALVLIHAINPFGFAWLSRTTHENVDLNRNFVDHRAGAWPANPGYDALADAIVPAEWTDDAKASADRQLDAFGDEHGQMALQAAISIGQWRHPDGVFYGGNAATWSRRALEAICCDELASARRAVLLDFHTGLGPRGYGEPISCHAPDSAADRRAREIFGAEVTNPATGNSASAAVMGTLDDGIATAAPWAEWTSLALEFGVVPLKDTLDAIRADAWLARDRRSTSHAARAIRQRMRETFYGDDAEWKTRVWARGSDFTERALAALARM